MREVELMAEIERLRGEADSWKAEARSMHALLFEKDAEIERLRADIRALELNLAAKDKMFRAALAGMK